MSTSAAAATAAAPQQEQRKRATPLDHGIAGNVAGAASALLFHPLDLIRVRMVSQDGTELRKHGGVMYRGFSHALRHIVATEGAAALFRGAALGLVASGVTWGLYMALFRWLEAAATAWLAAAAAAADAPKQPKQSWLLGFPVSAVASAGASVCVSFMTAPLFLIKTRMQLEDVAAATKGAARVNCSFCRGIMAAVERDGVRSLWRGFSAQLLMCCTMSIYMPLYEALRRPACAYLGRERLQPSETAAVTVAAKLAVTCVNHPIQLVKARLQDQRARVGETTYVRLHEAVQTVVRREGVRGFYRGLTVGMAQSTCRAVAQMVMYERVLESVVRIRASASSSSSSSSSSS